jgi:hypothetical protein
MKNEPLGGRDVPFWQGTIVFSIGQQRVVVLRCGEVNAFLCFPFLFPDQKEALWR